MQDSSVEVTTTACETGVAARLGVAAPTTVIILAPLLRELAVTP